MATKDLQAKCGFYLLTLVSLWIDGSNLVARRQLFVVLLGTEVTRTQKSFVSAILKREHIILHRVFELTGLKDTFSYSIQSGASGCYIGFVKCFI